MIHALMRTDSMGKFLSEEIKGQHHFKSSRFSLKTEVKPTGANGENRGEKTDAHKIEKDLVPLDFHKNPSRLTLFTPVQKKHLGVRA